MNGNDLLKPEFIWIVIGLLLLISEFAVPGLVVGFFGAGAIGVGVICFLTDLSLNAQILAFLVGSVGMMLCLRTLLLRAFPEACSDDESEDAMDVVGHRARVVEAITPEAGGRVEFHGSQWCAEAVEAIPRGELVTVIGRDNLTLRVTATSRS